MAKSNSKRNYGCGPSQRGQSFSSIGPTLSGFDAYGYPIVRSARLPESYHISNGRVYGQTAASATSILPMKLVDAPAPPVKPGLVKVDGFKLKPYPNVPAAPAGLPEQYKFCVQKGASGYFFRFRDAKTPLHGSEANVVKCEGDLCMVNMPGSSALKEAPICSDIGNDKEQVGPDCCVRIVTGGSGQIVCPGSSYDLMLVKIVATENVKGLLVASIEHPDLPGGGTRLPVCEAVDENPLDRICCIEEKTGLIVCPEGVDFPLRGMSIPLEFLEFVSMPDGLELARLRCGDINMIPPSERAANPTLDAMFNVCEELGGYIFPLCSQKPRPTPGDIRPPDMPKNLPDICCYDAATGTLVCEGSKYHGIPVNVVARDNIGGKEIVSVESDALPGGGMRVPVCPALPEIPRLPPSKCCVVETSSKLVLVCDPSTHHWNGKDVTSMGECFNTPNGRFCVIKFNDSNGEVVLEIPVCPPEGDRPSDETPDRPDDGETPDDERIPDDTPFLPPTEPPADDSECGDRCRRHWVNMVEKPAKLSRCDQKWLDMLEKLKSGGLTGPGHRFSGLRSNRRYSGCTPSVRGGRFPGLRGGRRTIESLLR